MNEGLPLNGQPSIGKADTRPDADLRRLAEIVIEESRRLSGIRSQGLRCGSAGSSGRLPASMPPRIGQHAEDVAGPAPMRAGQEVPGSMRDPALNGGPRRIGSKRMACHASGAILMNRLRPKEGNRKWRPGRGKREIGGLTPGRAKSGIKHSEGPVCRIEKTACRKENA